MEVRRLFWIGPIPVTPFVAASFPTHDYETVGEAVPGRHRRDLQFGAQHWCQPRSFATGSYIHARYGYATAQQIEGFAFTRSNVDVEVGYPVTSRVMLRGLVRLADPPSRAVGAGIDRRLGASRSVHRPGLYQPGGGCLFADRSCRAIRDVGGNSRWKQWRAPRENNRGWRHVRIRIEPEWTGEPFREGPHSITTPFRSHLKTWGFGTSPRRSRDESGRRHPADAGQSRVRSPRTCRFCCRGLQSWLRCR